VTESLPAGIRQFVTAGSTGYRWSQHPRDPGDCGMPSHADGRSATQTRQHKEPAK
jgi:hypothetical protein